MRDRVYITSRLSPKRKIIKTVNIIYEKMLELRGGNILRRRKGIVHPDLDELLEKSSGDGSTNLGKVFVVLLVICSPCTLYYLCKVAESSGKSIATCYI